MRFILSILTLLALVMPARSASIVSPTNLYKADIDWALTTGSTSGDTISLPAGSLQVTNPFVITKPLKIIGQGTNATIFLDEVMTESPAGIKGAVFAFTNTLANEDYRLAHISIIRGITNRASAFTSGSVRVTGNANRFSMDHVYIGPVRNALFMLQESAVLGIIHSSTLVSSNTQIIRFYHDRWGGHLWGDGAWTNAVAYGTTNAGFYVENNTFQNVTGNQPVTDSFGGGMWVFRFNTIYNGYIDMHGLGSTARYRATRGGEIYGNTIDAYNYVTLTYRSEAIDSRSGSWLVFSNTASATKFMTLHDYRWEGPLNIWYGVDGYTPWDNIAAKTIDDTGTATADDMGYIDNVRDPPPLPRTLTDASKSWTTDEHRGKLIRNTTAARTNAFPSSPANQSQVYWWPAPGQKCAVILSNTATVIYFSLASQYTKSFDCYFLTGDTYEIVGGVTQSMDMSGLGAGDLLDSDDQPTPVWLNQTVDMSYAWANTLNGGASGSGVMLPDLPNIIEGVHFTNNVAKPGYTPLQYPHPLVTYYGGGGVAVAITVTGNSQPITDGSATPSLGNHTGFGSVDTNLATLTRTYTILNGGTNTANIGTVTLSGAQAAAFTVIDQPDSTIAAGGSTTFQVRFDPSSLGLNQAEVSFSTDDPVANPFNFAIEGTGVDGAAAEIVVRGNSAEITDGDGTPSTSDDTDFASVSAGYYGESGLTVDTRTIVYTVENTGNSTLTLGTVTVGGTHASDFVVSVQPASSVTASSSTTFSVRFTPGATGTRSATISFTTSDSDENPFNFSIQGTGVTPNIAVTGNGNGISSGDSTPSESDYSGFGSTIYDHTPVSHAFVITNSGTQTLEITSVAIAGSARFSISVEPDVLVSASGTTSFTVAFAPTGLGTEQATVLISTNDPDTPLYSFAIEGTGIGGNRGVPYGGRIIRR